MESPFSPDFPEVTDEDIALHLLLEGIYLKYGYDFRSYSRPMVKRRVLRRVENNGFKTIFDLQKRVLTSPAYFQEILLDFFIHFTELFRDPSVFKAIRKSVVPILRTYPSLNIWHAGCATGQEVYSMAILLHEEGLLEKTHLYGTDISESALEKAKAGVYPASQLELSEARYRESGGEGNFAAFIKKKGDWVTMQDFLKKKISFHSHNLATDQVFGEMHLILCRNVVIYFDKSLRARVFELFHKSLCDWGFLCLGWDEFLEPGQRGSQFQPFLDLERIYRQIPDSQ